MDEREVVKLVIALLMVVFPKPSKAQQMLMIHALTKLVAMMQEAYEET